MADYVNKRLVVTMEYITVHCNKCGHHKLLVRAPNYNEKLEELLQEPCEVCNKVTKQSFEPNNGLEDMG